MANGRGDFASLAPVNGALMDGDYTTLTTAAKSHRQAQREKEFSKSSLFADRRTIVFAKL